MRFVLNDAEVVRAVRSWLDEQMVPVTPGDEVALEDQYGQEQITLEVGIRDEEDDRE